MKLGASINCFVGSCSCQIQVVDSELGTGCIKIEDTLGKNSKGEVCNCGPSVSCSPYDKTHCYSCNCSPSCCLDVAGVKKCMSAASSNCGPGSYPIGLSACGSCEGTCSTCEDGTTCLTCKSPNAVPANTGCQCISSAYDSDTSSDSINCIICPVYCLTCNASGCLTCRANNADVIGGNCICKAKFFQNLSLDNPDACQPCHAQCSKCSSSLICDECLTSQALQSPSQGCYCPVGTYANPDLSSPGSICSSCHPHCESCLKADTCTACKSLNATLDSLEGCKCSAYFFQISPMENNNACSPCALNCSSCTGKDYYKCLSCDYFLVDQVCFEIQPLGYFCNDLKVCQALKPPFLSFSFQGSGRSYFESVSGWVARVDYDGIVHIAGSMDRGVYLFGTRGLEVSVEKFTIFGTEFSFSIWINTNQPEFILLEKKLENTICVQISFKTNHFELITLIDSVPINTKSVQTINFSAWNHLLVVLDYTLSSTFARFYVNGVEEASEEISPKPFAAVDTSSLFIGSAKNWTKAFKGFIFKCELYVLDPGIRNLIETNANGCSLAPAGHGCIPLCNLTQYSLLTRCEECPKECIYGCKNNLTCSLCADDHCSECSRFDENSCYVCAENWVVKDKHCQICENSTYYEKSSCFACEGLCATCESKSKCKTCRDFSSFKPPGKCECDSGYVEKEKNCSRLSFSFKFGIFQNNTIWLSFSEPLTLKKDQIKVKLSKNKLNSVKLAKINSFLYNLELFFNNDVNTETTAQVQFIKEVVSTKNSLLLSETFELRLFETSNIEKESEINHNNEESRFNARTTVYFGISAAAAASVLSRNLNSIFSFLNIAEMIYAAYFFNIDLYPPLAEFILGLRVQSSIPNLFSFFISDSLGLALPKKFHKYGFKTNILLLNCGVQFTLAVAFLIILIFLYGIRKLKVLSGPVSDALSYFKYVIFFRLLIQSFFDFLLACSFGLEYRNYSSFIQVFNLLVCLALMVMKIQGFQVVSICGVLIILKRLMNTYSNISQADLKKSFSVLFDEFKEDSISCNLYYFLYMLRRLVLAMVISLAKDHLIQLTVAAVYSLTVTFIKMGFYVLLTRCFKKEIANILNIITELLISAYFFILLFSSLSVSKISWENAGKKCIIVVFTIWGVNISGSIYISFLSIREKATDFCRARKGEKVTPFELKMNNQATIFTRQ